MNSIKFIFAVLAVGFCLSSNPSFAQPRPQSEIVWCKSSGFRYNECRTRWIRRIRDVRVWRPYSSAACQYGYTYGISRWGDSIWVDRGCEADFEVYGY